MAQKADLESNFLKFSGGGPPDPPTKLRFCQHIHYLPLWDVGEGGVLSYLIIWYLILDPPQATNAIMNLV